MVVGRAIVESLVSKYIIGHHYHNMIKYKVSRQESSDDRFVGTSRARLIGQNLISLPIDTWKILKMT